MAKALLIFSQCGYNYLFMLFCVCFIVAAAATIPGNSPQLRFIGRHERQEEFNLTEFDWIGSGVAIQIQSPTGAGNSSPSVVVADLDAVKDTRFSVYRQEIKEGMLHGGKVQLKDFFTGNGRAKYTLAELNKCDNCVIYLIKTNEDPTSNLREILISSGLKPHTVGPGHLPLSMILRCLSYCHIWPHP